MDNTKIDALIIETASDEWVKIALIISQVFEILKVQGVDVSQDMGQTIAGRIYILVDNGGLSCQGNMRRWREADVRLVGA